MKKCPVCEKEELEGALYCSECGERLESKDKYAQNVCEGLKNRNTGDGIVAEGAGQIPLPESLCIKLVESGKVISLQKDIPIILGRLVDGTPLLPDYDLTGLSLYANGVSRLHAEFCWNEDGVFVSDLGSVNGTKINGISIQPNIQIRINSGDIVELGKVKAEISLC